MKATVACHVRTGFHKRLFYLSMLKKAGPDKHALLLEENMEICKVF